MSGVVNPARAIILGDGTDATKKLSIITNMDGTFTIARGEYPSTTQNILTIDVNGRVVMPQKPAFHAYGSATYTPTTGSILQLGNELLDTTGSYNTSTYQFTAPVTGIYLFSASIVWTSIASGTEFHMYKNGTALGGSGIIGYEATAGYSKTSSKTIHVSLVSGDVMDVRATVNNSSAQTVDSFRCSFSGHLI